MIEKEKLYEWCKIPADQLEQYKTKVPFRIVRDSEEMGELMADELIGEIAEAARRGKKYRAIIPCGPNCWYKPFTRKVNEKNVSLKNLEVFHMDECLDWQGNLLKEGHPYNFRSCMMRDFYLPIKKELAVLEENRHFLTPASMEEIRKMISEEPIDITYGGWGQDGHIAYNQSRRHPYSGLTVSQLREASIRIQENNWDTVIALAQRTFGAAYQFVPPMSITLGIKECLSARKIRLFSDTGSWKQTAFRVALFSDADAEYPITLLQTHPDAQITATLDTARHPVSEHQEWELY